MVLFKA